MDIGDQMNKDILYYGTKTFCSAIFEFLKITTSLTIKSAIFSTNFMSNQIQRFKNWRKNIKDINDSKKKSNYLKNIFFF